MKNKDKLYENDLEKSIGNMVFKNIRENTQYPKNLILKVRSLGRFIVRYSKIAEYVEQNERFLDGKGKFSHISDEHEKRRIQLKLWENLEEQYDKFREKKKTYRKLKDEFRLDIQPEEV